MHGPYPQAVLPRIAEQGDVVPIDLPVLFFLELHLQVPAQPPAVLRRPAGNAVQLPAAATAGPAAGGHDAVFHRLQPLIRGLVRPHAVVAGTAELGGQDLRVIDDLIAVQNNGVFDVLPDYIQGGDVVAGAVIGILNEAQAGVFPLQPGKLLLQIPHHHIDLPYPVVVQALYHGVDHPHTVDCYQGLWRCQCHRLHPVAEARRHDDGPFGLEHAYFPSLSRCARASRTMR